jgi:hypothetical protein
MRWFMSCLMGAAILMAGCAEKPAPSDKPRQFILQKSPPKPPEPPPLPDQGREPPYQRGGKMQLSSDPLGGPATVVDTTQVKAEAGVGAKGRRLDNPNLNKMIVTPARTLFRVQERLVFEVTVPHAVQLFEASNGRRIKSHAEFMEQVIRANQIQLPELPAGQRYVFDPDSGELMVEKPAG